jgi:DNA-directed RNA polymerase specialized sigma24 family protein
MPVVDEVLAQFLQETSEIQANERLNELLTVHLSPVVSAVLRRRLGVSLSRSDSRHENQRALDLAADVTTSILAELRALRAAGEASPGDFRAYAAQVAHNACHDYLRERYPQRRRLKNRVRYLLGHHPAFTLSVEGSRWLCRLEPCHKAVAVGATDRTQSSGRNSSGELTAHAMIRQVTGLLERHGGQLELDDLVNRLAALVGIEEPVAHSVSELHEDALVQQQRPLEAILDDRARLIVLWAEVCVLPARQRVALLLNLRDPGGAPALPLLPLAGIATISAIARALEMTPGELAAIWTDLPLEDAEIAGRLMVTRQQVINLRKSARARLARRTAHLAP